MNISTESDSNSDRSISRPRHIGRLIKGFVIGFLLPFAIIELIALGSDIAPFKYQGF